MTPTALQRSILEKFEIINDFTSVCDGRQEIVRAFALGMLWQTVSSKGSKSTLISSEPELGRHVMDFLKAAIKRGPQDLQDICNYPRPDQIQFGPDVGWNIHNLTPKDWKNAAKRGVKTRTALILKENSSDVAFIDAKDALIGAMTQSNRRILHLW